MGLITAGLDIMAHKYNALFKKKNMGCTNYFNFEGIGVARDEPCPAGDLNFTAAECGAEIGGIEKIIFHRMDMADVKDRTGFMRVAVAPADDKIRIIVKPDEHFGFFATRAFVGPFNADLSLPRYESVPGEPYKRIKHERVGAGTKTTVEVLDFIRDGSNSGGRLEWRVKSSSWVPDNPQTHTISIPHDFDAEHLKSLQVPQRKGLNLRSGGFSAGPSYAQREGLAHNEPIVPPELVKKMKESVGVLPDYMMDAHRYAADSIMGCPAHASEYIPKGHIIMHGGRQGGKNYEMLRWYTDLTPEKQALFSRLMSPPVVHIRDDEKIRIVIKKTSLELLREKLKENGEKLKQIIAKQDIFEKMQAYADTIGRSAEVLKDFSFKIDTKVVHQYPLKKYNIIPWYTVWITGVGKNAVSQARMHHKRFSWEYWRKVYVEPKKRKEAEFNKAFEQRHLEMIEKLGATYNDFNLVNFTSKTYGERGTTISWGFTGISDNKIIIKIK